MSYNFDRLNKAKMKKRKITKRDIQEALADPKIQEYGLSPNPDTGNDRFMCVGMTTTEFKLLEIGIEVEQVGDLCIFHVMKAGQKAIEDSGYEI